MKKATISRTPNDIAQSVEEAQRELITTPDGKQQTIEIKPARIATRPELFQPRGFATRKALDIGHVTKLTRRIATKGQLEPPLVVKLGREWVCVDGHHRIAAYMKHHGQNWHDPIECHWFAGTIREAVDESVKRNDFVKLEMRRGDKYEAAWQRVVLGWGSKKKIREITGVSDGLIGMMRRVVEAYKADDAIGRELRLKIRPIDKVTWSEARGAYLNLKPAEWDHREAARKLALFIRSRLQDRLSDNKVVTALALAIYDPDLPGPLATELWRVKDTLEDEEEGHVDGGGEEPLTREPLSDLLDDLGRLRDKQGRTAARIGTAAFVYSPRRDGRAAMPGS